MELAGHRNGNDALYAKQRWMVMGMREKLIELIGQAQDCGCDVTDVVEMNYVENAVLIDHLIANGVTIPVRCKECVWCEKGKDYEPYCNHPTDGMHDVQMDDFCSYGERRTDDA